MSRNRFVTPEVKRLELSDGDWVEVKRRLGIAEAKRIESAIFRGVQSSQDLSKAKTGSDVSTADVEVKLDPTAAYMVKLEVYLVEWSFCDAEDKHVKCTPSAIAALDPETADEIMDKLNEFLDAEAEARKDPFTKKSSKQLSA